MKKIIAFLLVLTVLILCFSSCSDTEEEVPTGMKICTCDGAPYRLYVPTTWNDNNSQGVSGAYYNLSTQSSVSVTCNDGQAGDTLDTYFENHFLPVFVLMDASFVLPEVGGALLGGIDAKSYAFTVGDNHYHIIITFHEAQYFVFSFICNDALYDSLTDNVNAMIENFKFAEPYQSDSYAYNLKKVDSVPDGMQNATDEKTDVLFFVPSTWTVDRESPYMVAYEPTDRSSISLMIYMASKQIATADDYFDENVTELKKYVKNYQLISSQAVTLDGKTGMQYEYQYDYLGKTYHLLQVIVAVNGTTPLIYHLTYTALEENYALHLNDFSAVCSAFGWD